MIRATGDVCHIFHNWNGGRAQASAGFTPIIASYMTLVLDLFGRKGHAELASIYSAPRESLTSSRNSDPMVVAAG